MALILVSFGKLPSFGFMDIQGIVWFDVNGNGIRESGEPGINGVHVNFETTAFPAFFFGTTYNNGGVDGFYGITAVPPFLPIDCDTNGYLRVEISAGFVITAFHQGGNSSVDSDIHPETELSDLLLNSCPNVSFPTPDVVYQVDIGLTGSPGPLDFEGFLSPIGGADATGGSYNSPLRTFKLNSTIPVKFSISSSGSPVLTGVHTLQLIKWSSQTDSTPPIDATPTDAATTGDQFQLVGTQWHFNLDAQATGMSVGTWQIVATLSDDSEHFAWIQIK